MAKYEYPRNRLTSKQNTADEHISKKNLYALKVVWALPAVEKTQLALI